MSLADFARNAADSEATLTVLNREQPPPLYQLLTELFDESVVSVETVSHEPDQLPSDLLLLERGDTAGFAVSSMETLKEELLLVNSDIYVTGARQLGDVDTPDIIRNMDELPFTVRGSPTQSNEKLLLIEISRHIEAKAWQTGEGRLATGFQYLSRLADERGTRKVYERLGCDTSVDTHIYGVADTAPTVPQVTVHAADTEELRHAWFVAYEPADPADEAAALVAYETGDRTWRGRWTYRADRVADILDYLDRAYQ